MVHRSETREYGTCSACGAEIDPGRERGYTFGADGLLCWACAIRRGGSWDAAHERWARPPRVDDLLARNERDR